MATVLQLKDFTKSYDGQKPAVDHVSLEVEEGEIFGFIGHNGAGKSTTIKSIVGILSSHNGEIYIDGKTLWEAKKECQKKMAYIPDNPDLYEYMTGISYINFIADIYEVPTEVRTERIEKIADAFEIKEALGDLISSYSHGMKQKVALISAFVHQPRLLVLDEPFVGLDPKASAVLKQEMRALCAQGSAIFFSTHVLEVAEKLCDKVAMIDHGHIVVSGSVEELTREASLEEVFLEQLELAKAQVESHA
ncbi:ABC transporter ATP-binding protein [Roseburia sp. NSJ-9]|jgi:ABC-2 type transport system ATP-binding protein|uniref:ABC transporter ATP-binding protein n=1 Tax=Roseburia lenta TaxID=2763061 RepID=A0ABR7GDY2_9FIRM|nr:ABC transporter ATP-binding protein [Roseburia lenta]MBC5685650.1 ABC transporter ATP-binding protein [Roseburia lenta]